MAVAVSTTTTPTVKLNDGWVYFQQIGWDKPHYHAFNDATGRTSCGRRPDQAIPSGGIFVPIKHAKKFAEPCKKCFKGVV
jgi:hypothetical protein